MRRSQHPIHKDSHGNQNQSTVKRSQICIYISSCLSSRPSLMDMIVSVTRSAKSAYSRKDTIEVYHF